MSLHIVILAAGQGKRMHSALPKVLHTVGGLPMLERVVNTASALNPDAIHIIVGHGSDRILQSLPTFSINWVLQESQQGTGHALMQALPHIPANSMVLVLYGDVPLIQVDTLQTLISLCAPTHQALSLLVATMNDPTGLGRIVRDVDGKVRAIVEEKDASLNEQQIKEIYSGICCVKASALNRWLPHLSNDNAQGEYYLTEIISKAVNEQLPIATLTAKDAMEVQGVNNRLQLQQVERALQARLASQFMLAGVTIADGARVDIRGELTCGTDVFIDVNTIFSGNVFIGDGSQIGANCSLNEVSIGQHCHILPNSVLDHCQIGDHCQVGPFARLRPGTQLASDCKIGNFVETKNAVLDAHSKASHLTYLGDVTIGKNVNIGAGTITCNYDGAHKYQTIIKDGVFIGSDTQLIAPVTVNENATIAAGSTICKDVPAGGLTLTEAKQKTLPDWIRPTKEQK